MEKGKLIYETTSDRGYTAKAWEIKDDAQGESLIEICKDNNIVRSFKFPSYKIWNISAHLSDIVDSEIANNTNGYSMAASTGLEGL